MTLSLSYNIMEYVSTYVEMMKETFVYRPAIYENFV